MTLNAEQLLNKRFEPITRHYSKRDVMLYALGIGAGTSADANPDELRLVYEAELVALPTMAVTMCDPGFWVAEPSLGITWQMMLHAEQHLTIHRPMPAGGRFVGQEKVVALYDKGDNKGSVMRVARTISDEATGEVIAVSESVGVLRADGGWGGPPVPVTRREDPPATPPDVSCELTTRPEQALLYRLSGDYNPLHVDPKVAAQAGFTQPILHGLCTYGIAARALIRTLCGGDPARLKRLDVRFSAPTFPGESVLTEAWKTGPGRAVFRSMVRERAAVVLNNGVVEFEA